MKKLLIFFLLIVFHSLLFAQTDTIPAESVISKKVNISGVSKTIYFNKNDTATPLNAVVISFDKKCKDKISKIEYIKNGIATKAMHYIYDNFSYPSCRLKKIYCTDDNNLKQGQYILINSTNNKKIAVGYYKNGKRDSLFILFYPDNTIKMKCYYKNDKKDSLSISYYPDKTKQSEGYFKNGEKDSLYPLYNKKEKPRIYKYYNNGKRIFKTIARYYKDTIKIKNIFTIDIPTLTIKEYKLCYQRMLNKRNAVYIELEDKPNYKTTFASDNFTFRYTTTISDDYLYCHCPYIGFLPASKQIKIGYKYLFSYNLRKPFYLSSELFYLTKWYNNIKCNYYNEDGDETTDERLQSFKCTKYGIMFNLGKEFIIGKSKNIISEIFDFYVGLGFDYANKITTVFGEYYNYTSMWSPSIPLFMNSSPQVTNKIGFQPTANFGIRFGFGFK